MDAACQFRAKRVVDHAVAFDPGLAFEGLGYNMNAVVSLAAGAVACMAGVLVGLILHLQALWCESPGQLTDNIIVSGHLAGITVLMVSVNDSA
jgi:hypothetical protein